MKDVYVRKPNDKERRLLEDCPIWEHDPAMWDAMYDKRCETCLIIEGTAVVTCSDGQSYAFTRGDLVTFRPDMACVWKVLEKIRKHYIFDMEVE
ncbi:cupin domain-containing protein [[Clostridium] innocuum]|nr:cupin domain-containing protein [[Clostridium] innocuum]MCR0578945.1 cupin domain-containing protein [[Clostridium] innocuum]